MENTIRITAGELRKYYTTVLAKLDFDTARIRTLSEIILASSDFQAISVLFDRVTSGLIDPKALPVHAGKKRRSVMIDGSRTEPHLTCLLAMECACETAAAEGIGMVLVRGLLPVQRLRLYEKVAAAHGLVTVVREAVYEDGADAKITHSFVAVDPGHFGDREELSPLLIEFAQKTGDAGIPAPDPEKVRPSSASWAYSSGRGRWPASAARHRTECRQPAFCVPPDGGNA